MPTTRSKIKDLGPCFSRSESNLAITSARAEDERLIWIGARDRDACTSTKPLTHDSGKSIFFSTVEEIPVSIPTESEPTVRCSGLYSLVRASSFSKGILKSIFVVPSDGSLLVRVT